MKKRLMVLPLLIFSGLSHAVGFDDNYKVYPGDINSDSLMDLYIKRDKPNVTILHSVPTTPIDLTEIDGFVLTQNSDGKGFTVKVVLTTLELQTAETLTVNDNLNVSVGACEFEGTSDLIVAGLIAEGISSGIDSVSVYAHENKDPGSFIASSYSECQHIVENSLVVSSFTEGRMPGTAGSENAVDFLVKRLQTFSEGFYGGRGASRYKQHYSFSASDVGFNASGTNVIAKIPGTGANSDEVVVIGAHYDHLGDNTSNGIYCHNGSFANGDVNDNVCNGATDNATGVTVVLQAASEIAKQVKLGNLVTDRTLLVAFWDGEEVSSTGLPGLLGSADFIDKSGAANPLPGFDAVPLSKIHAYINIDIAGLNLLPSLKGTTFLQGAETGGFVMESVVDAAVQSAIHNANQQTPALNFNPERLSYPFGHDRSDHTRFTGFPLGFGENYQAQNGVPTVFLSDANGACYHTIGDDMDIVDFDKLAAQTDLIRQITEGLLNSNALSPPVAYIHDSLRTSMAQYVTLDDVEVMHDVIVSSINDATQNYSSGNLAKLTDARDYLDGFLASPATYVAGAPSFHGAFVLNHVREFLGVLSDGTCERY